MVMSSETTLNIHNSLADIRITNARELFSIVNHLTISIHDRGKDKLWIRRTCIISKTPVKITLNGQEFNTSLDMIKLLAVKDPEEPEDLCVELHHDFKLRYTKRKMYELDYESDYYTKLVTLNTERIKKLGYQVNYSMEYVYTPRLVGTKEFYNKHKMFNMKDYVPLKENIGLDGIDVFQRMIDRKNDRYKYNLIFKVKVDDLKDLYYGTRTRHTIKPNPIQAISLKEYYGNMYREDKYYYDNIQCKSCNITVFIPKINNYVTTPDDDCYILLSFIDSLDLIDSVSEDSDLSKIFQRMKNEQE